MSLRFFADHCVSNSIILGLEKVGHNVLRLRDYLPIDSPDKFVISKAQELDCILISLNGDFADIVSYPPSSYKGILALQIRNHPEIVPHIMENLISYISTHRDMGHYIGKLLLVEPHIIRSRS